MNENAKDLFFSGQKYTFYRLSKFNVCVIMLVMHVIILFMHFIYNGVVCIFNIIVGDPHSILTLFYSGEGVDLPPPSRICVYTCVYAYTRANFL